MNQIVIQQTQLPAHLQQFMGKNAAVAAMQGITSGPSIYQISIKQAKWRLQTPQGGETIVPTHHMDVLIVDANPNLSKVFYAGAYNPAETDYKAPDCYSDNGQAPSIRALKPQSASCAACPHNVWGSKVNPNGAQTKACSDSKKLAVMLADNPQGPVYLLKIPAASLKNLYAFVESLTNRGIPLPAIVVRLEFDPQSDYPKVNFSPIGWANEEQAAAMQEVLGSDEVASAIGTTDQPRTAATPLPAPTPAAAPITLGPVPVVAPTGSSRANAFDNLIATNPGVMAATQPMTQPAFTQAPIQPVAAAPAAAPARKRRTKAEMAAASGAATPAPTPAANFAPLPQAAPQPSPAANMFAQAAAVTQDLPNAVMPAAAVNLAPAPTSSALDDLISQALKV